jgi:putative membrane protein
MIRKVYSSILIATSVGLASVAACGNAPGGVGSSSAGEQRDSGAGTSADAMAAANVAEGGDASASTNHCTSVRITDCSTGQIVAIAEALNTAEIDEANLALSLSSNASIKAFANQMVQDHTSLARAIATWLDTSGTQPVPGDISETIAASARTDLTTLRRSSQFDRDYSAHQVIDHVKTLGFFEHVLIVNPQQTSGQGVANAQAGSSAALAALFASARGAIAGHLQMAFALEQQVVGACGTPGATSNDAGAADASADAGDAGQDTTTRVDSGATPDSGADADASADANTNVPDGGDAGDAGDAGRTGLY